MKKHTAVRWSLEQAASEFDINPRTLSKRLKQYSIECGKDKKFSTKQICDACFGDIDGERLRLTKEQADEKALSNAEKRRELIPAAEFISLAERGLQAMVATTMGMTDLTVEQREKIIEQLREAGKSVVEVAGPDRKAPAALQS